MRFQVDAQQVALAAGQTRACGTAIQSQVSAMMGHLTVLQESWVGPAAGAFAGLAAQWRATQTQVEAALASIGVQLDTASNTYTQAESSAAALFAHGS